MAGGQNNSGTGKQADPYDRPPQKWSQGRPIRDRENTHENIRHRFVQGRANNRGRQPGVYGTEHIELRKEGDKNQGIVQGVEHQGSRQTPTAVSFADKEQQQQTDQTHKAAEVSKEADQAVFGAELAVDSEVELVI